MVVEVVGYVSVVGIPDDRLVGVPDVGVPGRRKGEERPLVVLGVVVGVVCSSVLVGDCVVVPSMDENIILLVELDVDRR